MNGNNNWKSLTANSHFILPPRACHKCALNHPITIVSIFVCVSVFFAVEASDDDSEGSTFRIWIFLTIFGLYVLDEFGFHCYTSKNYILKIVFVCSRNIKSYKTTIPWRSILVMSPSQSFVNFFWKWDQIEKYLRIKPHLSNSDLIRN